MAKSVYHKLSRPVAMNNRISCVAGGEKDKAVEGILLERKRKVVEQDLQNAYGQDGFLSPDVTEYFEYNRLHMDPSFYLHYERFTIEMANNNLVCISEAFRFSIGMARSFSGITETQFIDLSTGNQIAFDDLFMYPDVARETARGIASPSRWQARCGREQGSEQGAGGSWKIRFHTRIHMGQLRVPSARQA